MPRPGEDGRGCWSPGRSLGEGAEDLGGQTRSLGSSWGLRATRWRRGSPCTPVPMPGGRGKGPPPLYTHRLHGGWAGPQRHVTEAFITTAVSLFLSHWFPHQTHSSGLTGINYDRKSGGSGGKTHLSQQVGNQRLQLLVGPALARGLVGAGGRGRISTATDSLPGGPAPPGRGAPHLQVAPGWGRNVLSVTRGRGRGIRDAVF